MSPKKLQRNCFSPEDPFADLSVCLSAGKLKANRGAFLKNDLKGMTVRIYHLVIMTILVIFWN